MARHPWYRQLDSMDCGPTCLRMVARYHGRSLSAQSLRAAAQPSRSGISMADLARLSESVGLRTAALRCKFGALAEKLPLPCIAHWDQRHFVVVYAVGDGRVVVADPSCGVQRMSQAEFLRHWSGGDDQVGVVLLLEPTPEFFGADLPGLADGRSSLAVLGGYLARHRAYLFQLMIGLLVGSLLSFVLPFLTQSLVDYGVASRDLGFVYVLLLAQLMLFVGRTTIDFIRGWLVLHVGARINIALVADFLVHLMRLPMPFFDARAPGDILQRIDDHRRVEQFLTTTLLNVALSTVLLTVSSLVLFVYSTEIFVVFVLGSAAATVWTLLFMRRQKLLDHRAFLERAASQNTLMQMIEGMGEIKLATCELERRWDWERIQARLFRVTEKRLQVAQVQQAGSLGFGELKNIVITFFAANEVISGDMTLGMMLAVSYLLGQANRPLDLLLAAAQSIQDTRVSLERIAEIRERAPEVAVDAGGLPVPAAQDLVIKGLRYGYRSGAPVLRGIDLTIPAGKVTAIVGTSGSGKTTLLKLLLRFFEPGEGSVRVGDVALGALDVTQWRQRCGVVFQDGYVFSDTVLRNICLGDGDVDMTRLQAAARTARIDEWVRSLPRGFHTTIGKDGVGLSQGQRQRLLIARAIYKDPQFLFLDEATSALDAENERAIVEGLSTFLRGRTSVVIAHRLSTVRNADNIVVLEGGVVIEQGSHDELVARRGTYFRLISNQLELGA
ncbi:MAG: peptidase domain-containing ABC transporter [Nannocystaceae bacterium]|nr:peptidase domain-containing ABC transporter [Nannocystaceae bacterium]